MNFGCGNNNPMIGRKELGTPKNPAVLEDALKSYNKNIVDLLYYLSGAAA